MVHIYNTLKKNKHSTELFYIKYEYATFEVLFHSTGQAM